MALLLAIHHWTRKQLVGALLLVPFFLLCLTTPTKYDSGNLGALMCCTVMCFTLQYYTCYDS